MLTLTQWLLIGLLIAVVCVPLVRWFWKRWDRPTPEMIAHEAEMLEAEAESRYWSAIEERMEVEASRRKEWEDKQMAKAVALAKAKPLDEVSASKAWGALGVDQPIIISTDSEIETEDLIEHLDKTEIEEDAQISKTVEEQKIIQQELPELPSMIDLPNPKLKETITEEMGNHFEPKISTRDPSLPDDWDIVGW